VKTSLGAPHRYILFPGSELVSCDTVKYKRKSFAARHDKLKSRESSFLAERLLSILNFHCTLCCDLTDLSAQLQE
jgi:hypothetical protein